METCAVETGLLKKSACGHAAVAKCANCEMPLCSKHAVPQLSPTGNKTGSFLCGECNAAQKAHDKRVASAPRQAAPKPPVAKPAAQAAPAPAAKPPAKPAGQPPEKPPENSDGSIDFTPTKK
jgi:hypothetical protein